MCVCDIVLKSANPMLSEPDQHRIEQIAIITNLEVDQQLNSASAHLNRDNTRDCHRAYDHQLHAAALA